MTARNKAVTKEEVARQDRIVADTSEGREKVGAGSFLNE
jgi:hypothetical protein